MTTDTGRTRPGTTAGSWTSSTRRRRRTVEGLTPLSYWGYLQAIVTQFRSSPALGMWEPISEPEASTCPSQYQPLDCAGHQTCPNQALAARALRHFFDVVGAEIHALDPNHLVEDGMLGGGQCGTAGGEYEFVSGSPGIDVLSYHDYYPGPALIGGDQWNGLGVRFQQAAVLEQAHHRREMGHGGRTRPRMYLAGEAHERGHGPREGAGVSRERRRVAVVLGALR